MMGTSKSVFAILLVCALLLPTLTLGVQLVSAQEWLSDWQYRKPITVTAGSNGMPADYQLKVVIDTASLISAGKMRSDAGDIRFTKADGTTLLNYWISHGVNTSQTVIWVKDPDTLGANASHTLYLYYGNPNATSQSSFSSVFSIQQVRTLSSANTPWAEFAPVSSNRNWLFISLHNDTYSDQENPVYDVSTGTKVGGVASYRGGGGSWSGSANYVAVGQGGSSTTNRVYRTSDWTQVASVDEQSYDSWPSFKGESYMVSVYRYNGSLKIWRMSDWAAVRSSSGSGKSKMDFSPDGNQAALWWGSDLSIWDTSSSDPNAWGIVKTLTGSGGYSSWSSDGSELAVAVNPNNTSLVRVYNTADWSLKEEISLPSPAYSYDVDISSSFIAVSSYNNKQAFIYSKAGELLATFSYSYNPYSVDFNLVEQYLAVSTNQPLTYVYKVREYVDPEPTVSVGAEESPNQPPNSPTNLWCEGEMNPTRITDLTPEFSAIGTDNNGDQMNYYALQVDDDSGFGSPIWDQPKTAITAFDNGTRCQDITYAGSALSRGTTYYWRIKFWDVNGYEGYWSTETAHFNINSLPTAADLKINGLASPARLLSTTTTVTFSWTYADSDGDNQAKYEIWVGTSAGSSDMWNSGQILSSATSVQYGGSALSQGVTYYVQARTFDNYEWSAWVSGTLMINRPPTVPTSLTLNIPKVGQTLTATASGATDPDGDSITYYYRFYNITDGAIRQDWSTTNTYVVQVADAHDNIVVYARAYDGYEYSDPLQPLAAYWNFDEGSGTVVYDSSGNGNNGTIYGATWTSGKIGNALGFDGVDDYVRTGPVSINTATTSYTFSAWVKPQANPSATCQFVVGDFPKIGIDVSQDGAYVGAWLNGYHGGFITTENISDGQWHFVAAVYSAGDPTPQAKVYLDGEFYGYYPTDATSRPPLNYSPTMVVGYDPDWTGYSTATKGTIDEIRIYNRALTAEEIQRLYNSGSISASQIVANTVPSASDLKTEGQTNPTKLTTLTPTFSWSYSDNDGDAQAKYEVWVGTSSGSSNTWNSGQVSSSSASATYTGSSLSRGVTYYVQVRTYDGYEWSSWATGTFRLNQLPVISNMLTEGQANPTRLTTFTPTFSWGYSDPDADAQTKYEIWVGTTDGGSDLWDSGQVASNATSAAYGGSALSRGVTYYIQIRTYDGYEWSSWSKGTFRLNQLPTMSNLAAEVQLGGAYADAADEKMIYNSISPNKLATITLKDIDKKTFYLTVLTEHRGVYSWLVMLP